MKKEMIMTLFQDNVIEKVKQQFTEEIKIIPVESYDMGFRLFMPTLLNINLEILINMDIINEGVKEIDGIGKAQVTKYVRYFKPIGFYTKINGDNMRIEINIPYEFEKEYNELVCSHKLKQSPKVNKLSIKENAIIAAFSMETYFQAFQIFEEKKVKGLGPEIHRELDLVIPGYMKYDKRFIANGLEVEIIMSFEGNPQFYLDNKYNLSDVIAGYKLQGNQVSYSPAFEYYDLFEKYNKMSLLSVLKIFPNIQ